MEKENKIEFILKRIQCEIFSLYIYGSGSRTISFEQKNAKAYTSDRWGRYWGSCKLLGKGEKNGAFSNMDGCLEVLLAETMRLSRGLTENNLSI